MRGINTLSKFLEESATRLISVYRALTVAALSMIVQVGEVADARQKSSFHSPPTPTHH
jgi:hypothetical protein